MQFAQQRQEKAFKTMQRFLAHPIVEERLGRKEIIRILDFRCADGSGSVGIGTAVALKFAIDGLRGMLSPRRIRLIGIDSYGKAEKRYVGLKGAEIYATFLRPLELLTCSPEMGHFLGKFNIITLFNPSPPIDLLETIKHTKEKRIASGKTEPEKEMFEELRSPIMEIITSRFGIDPKCIESQPLYPILEGMKMMLIELPFKNVFPELLTKDGILFIAMDSLVSPESIRALLLANRYEVVMDEENCEENIFCPPGGLNYNEYLFGATITPPAKNTF
ncbi:MAG: hypothetical protein ABII22_02185 [Candidatus Micrarchaeota archaeon]